MKRMFICLILMFSASCASLSSWWEQNKNNPIAQAQAALSSVEIMKSAAIATFSTVKNKLPIVEQAKAQADFDKAMLALAAAESAVQDLINAVNDGSQQKPDFGFVFASMSSAITHIQYVVNLYDGMTTSDLSVMSADGPDELTRQAETLKARLH